MHMYGVCLCFFSEILVLKPYFFSLKTKAFVNFAGNQT